MPSFPHAELEEMIRRFVAANLAAGRSGDWSRMGEFYTDDAVYSWNNGYKYEFVARGKHQIREWAYGSEMSGLDGWDYPYVRTLIDDRKGEVVGFWRQLAPIRDANGKRVEVGGTGGSWFRYAGDFKWCWQRDFFDHANAAHVFMAMAETGTLPATMQERLKKGSRMPGWTKADEFDFYETIAEREDR